MDFDKVLRLLRAMHEEGVEYITCGAVALNFHGVLRATTDADFFIRAERENIERLKRALRRVWDDPDIDQISADDLIGDYPSVRYGPPDDTFSMDFLTRLGEVYSYENLTWQIIEYEGIPIRVVTAKTLYEMKKNTVRLMDKLDAERLRMKFPDVED
jgi:diphthamide synthase (EF-2-diphthine--ammonia ligase)